MKSPSNVNVVAFPLVPDPEVAGSITTGPAVVVNVKSASLEYASISSAHSTETEKEE